MEACTNLSWRTKANVLHDCRGGLKSEDRDLSASIFRILECDFYSDEKNLIFINTLAWTQMIVLYFRFSHDGIIKLLNNQLSFCEPLGI